MKETWRFHRSNFNDLKTKGYVVIPWQHGQDNQNEVMSWLRNNGEGEFCYTQERNKQNWSIVLDSEEVAKNFLNHFA